MDMFTVKVILALAATWGVPAQHGDIPKVALKMRKISIGHTVFQYAARREKQTAYGSSRDGVCDAVSSRDGVV
ncbi:unnamed protein product [Peronospora effusa]|nr:unnamed protein product [Peronospora effusa]